MTTPYTVKLLGLNLLSAVQTSFEDGTTTGWAAGTNTAVSNSATHAMYRTHSMALTSSAAGSVSATTPPGLSGFAVTAGTMYRAVASFLTAASARSCTVTINWYKSGGTASTHPSDVSTAVTDATSTWATAAVAAVAPSDAAFAAVVVSVAATAAGAEVHYIDEIRLRSFVTADALQVSQGPTWVLNSWGSFDFSITTVDPNAALCVPLKTELQLWFNDGSTDKCKWWGRIVRRECRGAMTDVQCLGLEWDLSGIELGPILTNFLIDPDFEDATLANWTAVGATKSSETTIIRKGTRSMKLVSASAGLDQYASQQFTIDNSAGSEPIAIFVGARFYATASAWIGAALQERGLFVKRIEGGVDQTEGATGQVGVWTPITNNGPFNQWARIVAHPVSVPTGHTQTIEVRLYSPGGTIYWDVSVAHEAESTGANTVTTYADINSIIGNVLTYAQDPASNKTDYHILSPAGTFGTTVSRQWQFSTHGNVWNDAILPFIDAGTLDAWIGFDDAGTTKTFNTAASKGTDRSGSLTLTLGGNATISSFSEDGNETAGAITVLSQGNAGEPFLGKQTDAVPLDDVAYSVDTTANGGITRAAIITSPPETTLDGSTAQATAELARRKELVRIPVWNTPADTLFTTGVVVGDTVKFDGGNYGWVGSVEVAKSRRIVEMTLTPDSNLMSVKGN